MTLSALADLWLSMFLMKIVFSGETLALGVAPPTAETLQQMRLFLLHIFVDLLHPPAISLISSRLSTGTVIQRLPFSIPACFPPPPPPCPVMHAHVDPRARLLHSASGEILTRLWCLLIVPLGDWDARRSSSPWWQWRPSPWRQPLTHKNTWEGEKRRTGGESWWRSTLGGIWVLLQSIHGHQAKPSDGWTAFSNVSFSKEKCFKM